MVSLDLLTDHAAYHRWDFTRAHGIATESAFSTPRLEETALPLHAAQPATNLALEWLAHDLKAVGWLKEESASTISPLPAAAHPLNQLSRSPPSHLLHALLVAGMHAQGSWQAVH
jgi:hypothetical protein